MIYQTVNHRYYTVKMIESQARNGFARYHKKAEKISRVFDTVRQITDRLDIDLHSIYSDYHQEVLADESPGIQKLF